MSRTNEELAVEVQKGNRQAAHELWEGVRKRYSDPLNSAQSLDAPLGDEGDGTFSDIIADQNGEVPLQDVEEELYQRELHEALEEELDKLPAPYGTILRMRYYDQCTYAEIAAAIGKSASNTRSLEGNALRRLRFTDSAKRLIPFYDFDYYHGTAAFHTAREQTSPRIQNNELL